MAELLTAAQMRGIEKAAIDSGKVTGLELMQRAGRGVVEAVFEEWPELEEGKRRAVVLCGPGNNGGDGFVVARLLRARGWGVEVFLHGDPARLPAAAKTNYKLWREFGEARPLRDSDFNGWPDREKSVDLIVDALFGTGLTRPFVDCRHLSRAIGIASRAFAEGQAGPRVVAIDLPSGLCSDSGRWLEGDDALDDVGSANLTVTFHREKLGHYLEDGPSACGSVVVADIGLADHAAAERVRRLGPPAEGLDKAAGHHKFSHGHALVLSGPAGRTGAARLAARGVLRIGAGLVTLGVPLAARAEVAAQVTAMMLREVGSGADLAAALRDERINALCLGPGLGVERAGALVAVALGGGGVKPRPTVLDADALTATAGDQKLFGALHEGCVLTPHGGEFARLFPDIAARLAARPERGPAYSKVDATREAAARCGAVVLFKGPDTVVAHPDGRCSVNAAVYERAAPWLATAGAGDVLAGFITGLLARGFDPLKAAETGAWLHVECARAFGPGLIAEDLPERLPQVFRALGL